MKKIVSYLLILLLTYGLYCQSSDKSQTTIYWDASLSMKERDIEREFKYLETYFNENKNSEVVVITFSNTVLSRDVFGVKLGNWSAIKENLSKVVYDGATSYNSLGGYTQNGVILLFTDGVQNMAITSPNFNGNLILVNSSTHFNQAGINLLTIVNEGAYINLIPSKNEGSNNARDNSNTYFGNIYGDNFTPDNVVIKVKGIAKSEIKPKGDGSYEIRASEGDVLVFSAVKGNVVEKELGLSRNINVWLEDSGEIRLDEVVLTDTAPEVEEEIITAYGKKNKNAVGYAVQSISEEDIPDASTTVGNAAQGKFSGVRLGQNDDLSQAMIRTQTSINSNNYPLLVVDGVPIAKSNSSSYNSTLPVQGTGFIDPQNVASITVLKSLAATNRYGSLGNNGALLITTKAGSFGNVDEKVDLARLTNNVYEGKIKVSNKSLVTAYLKELKKGKNIEEAYHIYLRQREQFWDTPGYFIDVFDFFKESSDVLAIRILSNILEREDASLMDLRGMLFKTQQLKDATLGLDVAHRILELYPNRIQSYIDVALAYKDARNYQTALHMLIGIADGSINEELNFSALKKTVGKEIRNLVHQNRNELDISKVEPQYLNNIRYDARVVFDWNTEDAQFVLQFVNPQQRFFKWDHTNLESKTRIRDELEQGYSMEEFEIIGADAKGDWIINVNYLGHKNLENNAPTFLKCAVQYNFGKPNQYEEVYVIRLFEKGSEELMTKLAVK